MSDNPPHERFVEAMRVLAKLPGYQNAKDAAADAFADQECGQMNMNPGRAWPDCKRPDHGHCRAALRAEIRGDKP